MGALFRLFLGDAFPSVPLCGEAIGGVGILVMLAIVAMVINVLYIKPCPSLSQAADDVLEATGKTDAPQPELRPEKACIPLPPCNISSAYAWSCYNVHPDACAMISSVI